ncbi:MAG TPA: 2-octaprenyl-6-methoxyphenyl hydroxylase [Chromatiaceae bacterium]|nr:2-octaprenyl-6-methoxyphenyl hydroxylase [Chromatiaceae bacterium]
MDGETYDLVIVGGGLVGGSLACALRGSRLRVCSLEAVAADADHQPSYDERVIALSWGSRRIFEGMGLWGDIAPGAEPIHRIHVSERGTFGFAHLDSAEQGVEALGYVAPARVLGTAIRGALACASDIDSLCPARLLGLVNGPDWVELEVAVGGEQRCLTTQLLAAAYGGESLVRNQLGIGVRERPYGQDAIITTVTPDRPQPGVAYERFTDTGPLAMLPMTGGRWSVVWTSRKDETAALLGLTDSAFLARLQERFGYRLGGLDRLGRRVAYPLRQVLATQGVAGRVVLIGNAAHTLHPVAGQGFNLGLRYVAALAEVLVRATRTGADPGGQAALADYAQWRRRDQSQSALVTDALARLFGNPWAPLRLARDLGLVGLDLIPAARRTLGRRFMGLGPAVGGDAGGRLPRLARGLGLEGHRD